MCQADTDVTKGGTLPLPGQPITAHWITTSWAPHFAHSAQGHHFAFIFALLVWNGGLTAGGGAGRPSVKGGAPRAAGVASILRELPERWVSAGSKDATRGARPAAPPGAAGNAAPPHGVGERPPPPRGTSPQWPRGRRCAAPREPRREHAALRTAPPDGAARGERGYDPTPVSVPVSVPAPRGRSLVPDDGLQLPDLIVHGQQLQLRSERRRALLRRGAGDRRRPVAGAAAVRAGAAAAAALGGLGETDQPGAAARRRRLFVLGPRAAGRAEPLVVARHRLHAPGPPPPRRPWPPRAAPRRPRCAAAEGRGRGNGPPTASSRWLPPPSLMVARGAAELSARLLGAAVRRWPWRAGSVMPRCGTRAAWVAVPGGTFLSVCSGPLRLYLKRCPGAARAAAQPCLQQSPALSSWPTAGVRAAAGGRTARWLRAGALSKA